MKTPKTSLLILCLVVVPCIMIIMFMSIKPPDYFHHTVYDVRVINGFSNNSSLPLIIWCSSDNTDMGGRALQEGDEFSWSFEAKFWDTSTLFFCTMKWEHMRKSFHAFQVGRDRLRCGPLKRCSWLVKEDGFYFSNDDVSWNRDFPWS